MTSWSKENVEKIKAMFECTDNCCGQLSEIYKVIPAKRNDKGQLHCIDGPALIWPSGSDAITSCTDGTEEWYYNGFKHRKGGPAIIGPDCVQYWFEGNLHRTDGPATIYPDVSRWYFNGFEHRDPEEGPAVEYVNGRIIYYVYGQLFSNKSNAIEKMRTCKPEIRNLLNIQGFSY